MGWRNVRVWDAYIEPGKWEEMRLGKREAERIPGTTALEPLWMGFVSAVSWQKASTWARVKTCLVARVVVAVVDVEVDVEDSTRWRRLQEFAATCHRACPREKELANRYGDMRYVSVFYSERLVCMTCCGFTERATPWPKNH
jgi:hypothetical protein